MSDRESWLNGWPRIGDTAVLIGTGVYCVGCGKDRGIATVAISDDWQPPERYPDYPFNPHTCPVCWLIEKEASKVDDTPRIGIERMRIRNLTGKLPQ